MIRKLIALATVALLAVCAVAYPGLGQEVERPYYVRDIDEVTGVCTVYTTMTDSEQQAFRALWEKYYPNCRLEYQADSIGTLLTRIRSDANCNADVEFGGFFATDGDANHDILAPYVAACEAEQQFHDESGYYTYGEAQVMCLVVNPELRDELGIEIKGYADLLNPALKGKIILAAPDSTSSGWRQLQTMLAVMGDDFGDEKAWAYIEQLIPSCFSTTSSKDVYNLVANGEYVVGLSYETAVAGMIKDGAGVECVYMEEGNTAVPGGVGLIKGAPNPAAGQAVVDLLSSAEWQNQRATATSGRSNNTLADLNGLPPADALGLVDLDYQYLADNKAEIMERWNELYATLH